MTEDQEINQIKKLFKIKPLKVWAGSLTLSVQVRRVIVAAASQKEALDLINRFLHSSGLGDLPGQRFRGTWGQTKNIYELEVAKEKGLWVNLDSANGFVSYAGRYEKVI